MVETVHVDLDRKLICGACKAKDLPRQFQRLKEALAYGESI